MILAHSIDGVLRVSTPLDLFFPAHCSFAPEDDDSVLCLMPGIDGVRLADTEKRAKAGPNVA